MAAADIPVHRSRLAQQIEQLTPRQQYDLGLPEALLPLWSLLVRLCHDLTDGRDTRSFDQRRDGALARLFGDPSSAGGDDGAEFLNFFTYLGGMTPEGAIEVSDRLYQLTDADHLDGLLGPGAHQRLAPAFNADVQVVAAALRQGIRVLLPYAVAVEDATRALSPPRLKELSIDSDGLFNALDLLQHLDAGLANAFTLDLPEDLAGDPTTHSVLTHHEIDQSLQELRSHVSTKSQMRLAELSGALIRKIHGARTALAVSEDGISQAANSLVELIDKSLRSAFSKKQVLAWLDRNFPHAQGVRYIKNGKEMPTKRGEVLCFVHAGQPVVQRSPYHRLVVAVICDARAALEALKHADDGTAAQVAQVADLLQALESSYILAFTIGWAGRPHAEPTPEQPAAPQHDRAPQ